MEQIIINIMTTSLPVGIVMWYLFIEKPKVDKRMTEMTSQMFLQMTAMVDEYDKKIDLLHKDHLDEYMKQQLIIMNEIKELNINLKNK